MSGQRLTGPAILDLLPQQRPFRYVDEILEVDEQRIVGRYTFREDEWFYPGHFPGRPVTPGVILLESMCQVGVVALGIYLFAQERSVDEARNWTTLFVDAESEFLQPVLPGETVTIRGERIFWRRNKLRARIEMFGADDRLVAQTTASGLGVRHG
jgi:3-hydroxyacyl-[acyl-carrier-protein] dehydratase